MISAKIIAHSRSAVTGKEIVTFELVYPRFIHGELMTHRMFSRNAASSRAIPISKMIDQVSADPAKPVHWGKNQAGMQAKEVLDNTDKSYSGNCTHQECAEYHWTNAAEDAVEQAKGLNLHNVHKQIVNRILEPFQWMKTVVTATEWENFFWLRNHEDAQPEIKRLAEVMLEALGTSEPTTLNHGDWHVPYFQNGCWKSDWVHMQSTEEQSQQVSLEDALSISSSCCAQVSYRLLDDSLEKARMIYKRLVESEPVHASPFEHQASPIEYTSFCDIENGWEEGVTHMDKEGSMWSGNFKGWIQHRQLIPNNVKM